MAFESQDEARLVQPVQFFGRGKNAGIRDFSPAPVAADVEEVAEVEEVLETIPKDESAHGSVALPTPNPPIELPRSETIAPQGVSPTELLEAAAKANGKLNERSEDEQPKATPTPSVPATSSPASSTPQTATTGGFPMPPAPVTPPTGAPTPNQ